jgi:pSer/pThr/pTyr-binding forkhead associated (FHA) protein/tetratricopeptide (TPR) repeat protein
MSVLIVSRDAVMEQRISLNKDVITIGRLEDNDIVLNDGSISRHHAHIERHGGQFIIKDQGSQNGIWVAGARVAQWELQPGVPFVMGVFTATYEQPAAEHISMTPPSVPVPGTTSPAKLFVIDGPVPIRELSLNLPEVIFGRAPSCHIPIDSEAVSRNHARISYKNNQFIISDAGSLNGVFVNGLRVESQPLQHGDEILIGPARFTFSATGEYVAPPPVPEFAPDYGGMQPPAGHAPSAAPPYAPMGTTTAKGSLFARIPKIVWIGGGLGIIIVIILSMLLSGPPKTERPDSTQISAENQQTIQRLLTEAKQYVSANDFQGALDKANAVLTPELDPKNKEALDLQALAQNKLAELAAARAKAEEEAAKKAAQVQALLAEASIAFKAEDLVTSKSKIEEARILDPENLDVKKAYLGTILAMAKVAVKKRDYGSAYEAYNTALQVDPVNEEAKKGRESVAKYEQAVKGREARIRSLFDEAKRSIERGDSIKAYRNLSEVLEMNPKHAQAASLQSQLKGLLDVKAKPLYDEGVRLFNAGQLVEGMRKLNQALEAFPDHAPTVQFMVQARTKCRNEAQAAFKRAYIDEGIGKYKDAMAGYQRTIDLLPDPNEEYHRKAAERMSQLKSKIK